MADVARARRLGERIKVLAAQALAKVVKDPDLGFVTFTDCRVTPDLAHARLFYTVYGTAEEVERSQEILEQNRGRLRGEIGRQLGIRITPTLELEKDDIPENAGQLAELLAEAKRRDEEVVQLASKAQPAGDADPYRKPQED